MFIPFNAMHGQVISKLRDHLLLQPGSHKFFLQTIRISSTINSYCYSLFSKWNILWNKIPSHVPEAGNSISKFKQALHRWLF